jgi:hypothetical protein
MLSGIPNWVWIIVVAACLGASIEKWFGRVNANLEDIKEELRKLRQENQN